MYKGPLIFVSPQASKNSGRHWRQAPPRVLRLPDRRWLPGRRRHPPGERVPLRQCHRRRPWVLGARNWSRVPCVLVITDYTTIDWLGRRRIVCSGMKTVYLQGLFRNIAQSIAILFRIVLDFYFVLHLGLLASFSGKWAYHPLAHKRWQESSAWTVWQNQK